MEIVDAVTEALLSMLSVTDEQLAVEVSSTAGSRDSERRLSSTEWQVDYEVTVGRNAADAVLLAAGEMSSSATALTQALTQALSSRGLQLEAGSVAVETPLLVEATELASSITGSGAGGTPEPTSATGAPTPSPAAAADAEAEAGGGLLVGVILGVAAAAGVACLTVGGFQVARRRRSTGPRAQLEDIVAGLTLEGEHDSGRVPRPRDDGDETRSVASSSTVGTEGNDVFSRIGARVEHIMVRLVRRSGKQASGIGVKQMDGKVLEVTGVEDTGLVGEWNLKYPTRCVNVGDHIVSVNGVMSNTKRMMSEFEVSSTLNLVVERSAESVTSV